jgi:hypothetical protein
MITVTDLQTRHARLAQKRQQQQETAQKLRQQLDALDREDIGFAYVLGELELMMQELSTAAPAEEPHE